MRKSFTAVTAWGSSDFGSAICATTSTPGGVWARTAPAADVRISRAVAARRMRLSIGGTPEGPSDQH